MILKLSQTTSKIPHISLEKAKNILDSIKPEVNDFYSITGNHYRYSGVAGLHHFQALINGIIDDINNASVEELNQVLACILYKSHQKDRTSDRSYRTISTCPYLSKAIDRYIAELYGHLWTGEQADTQLQGKGSNHELAALLLT